MKLLNTLSFALLLSSFLQGQDKRSDLPSTLNTSGSQANQQLKQRYVAEQGYLSPNSQLSLYNVYGDSLKGFDEKGLTGALISRGVASWEIKLHIENQKRKYIKEKYNLSPAQAVQNSSTNSNPLTGKKKGGPSTVNVAPCVNEGFEQSAVGAYTAATAVTGWTVSNMFNDGSCSYSSWAPGSPEFSLVATPLINWPFVGTPLTVVPHSPLGGTVVAQLNNGGPGSNNQSMTRIKQTFPVLSSNSLFQFAYAGYWEDGGFGHGCCDQPGLYVKMYDCNGGPLGCSSMSLSPNCSSTGATFSNTPNVASWCNWQVKQIDLTAYIGSCVTVEFMTTDCSLGGHWGTTLLDVGCGLQPIGPGIPTTNTINLASGPVSFCAGSGIAQICAPAGYATYQWWDPTASSGTMSAPQGTMACPTITNPIAGLVYTVVMTSASGCIYSATLGLSYSQVNVATMSSAPSCPLGSSGSATVFGNGSGAGYTYKWVNSSNQVVSTSSVATNLAPGTYKAIIGGIGSSGCGSDSSAIVVNAVTSNTQIMFQPYCGSPAYIPTPGGNNIKWYFNNAIIPGANSSILTVNAPTNNSIYWYSADNANGCRDSIMYTLVQGQAGTISVPTNSIKAICPSASNGTAAINLVASMGAPVGFNTFSVVSTGTTPAYVATVGPTSSPTFTFGGLSQGTYTVTAFDGSCRYNTNFVITPVVFNYTLTKTSATLCPGNSIPVGVQPSGNPNQFSYSWNPTTWFPGGNGNVQQSLLTPSNIPPGGSTTIVYTVVVTPTVAYCPMSKTVSITSVNPPIPSVAAVPALCDISSAYQLVATPGGGTFINNVSTPNLIGTSSGIISPTLAQFGVNQFTYAINVNTCVATTVASFQVSQFFSSVLTSTVGPLCVTSAPVNLMNIVQQSQNGKWYGTGIQGGSFIPSSVTGGVFTATYHTISSPDSLACPSSHTVNLNVTNTLVPSVVTMQPFCTNAPVRSMTVTPSGGTWSGTGISAAGVITPSTIIQPGNQVVNYSVTVGPCVNFVTTSFHVSRFNPATLTSSLQEQCFNNPSVNLMNYAQNNSTGSWSGPNVQNNVFSPSNLSTGVYELLFWTTSTPDPQLCPDSSMMKVSVLNPPQPVISQAGPFCSREAPAQLSVSPGGGQWTASTYINSNGVFTPSLAGIGNNGVEYVIGTPACNSRQTVFISVEAFVPADLTSHFLPHLCNSNAAINLAPYATYAGGWFGTGVNGTSFDPSIAGKGDFVLTHTTATYPSGLCPDQATVAVSVFSIQTPAIAKLGPFCSVGKPVQITADVLGGIYDGVNNNAVNNAGLFIPAQAITGENVISYTVTSGPCVAYAQTTINVEKFVSADFHTLPPTFCSGDNSANLDQFVFNPGGAWTGAGVKGNMFDPALANPGTNNEIVHNTWSLPTRSLCPDQKKIRIEVVKLPKLTAVANVDQGCAPLEVYFNVPEVNTGNGVWNTGDGTLTEKGGLSISHVYKTPGSYSVQLNYELKGCRAQVELPKQIKVFDVPHADFELPSQVFISYPEVQLVNRSTPLGENKYAWKIEGLDEIKGVLSPVVTIPSAGRYEIRLTAENVAGCKDEIVKMLQVDNDVNVFIPTSFSPNFDGLNDVFLPVFTAQSLDTKTFEMEIFDRWGHLLFRTTDATKGWNGSAAEKNDPLQEGTYVFKLRFRDLDGVSHNKVGHVTILK